MNIGLFFGSFNPVHIGHMIIANHMVQLRTLDRVWMVVSPQSPFKKKESLARDYDRLHLVHLAIGENPKLRASDIEFKLEKPSYTIDTLTYLTEKYPQHDFSLIMGEDNLKTFHKWKNYEKILENFKICVYQRPGYESDMYVDHPNVLFVEASLLNISASYIRKRIAEGFSVQYLVPDKVYDYLSTSYLYRK
jgi:nicotinate-nucleotide adenylyltransferase